MTEASHIPTEHAERLKSKQTLGEVLEAVIAFEFAAYRYFEALRWKVDKPLRALVTQLADEESRHYRLFRDLAEREHVHDHVRDLIQVPVSDHKFSDYIHTPDLGELPDDQVVLQYALGREQVAYEQYMALAKTTPVGPIRDLFRYLATEELRHKGELEEMYYALVHRGCM